MPPWGGPSLMMWPLLISTTRSAMREISRLWVTTRTARSAAACSMSSSSICAPVLKSSSPVGSSASRTGLPVARARAMATRCCSPPRKLVGEVVGPVAEAHGLQHRLG